MKKKLIGALTLALAGTMALGLAACGGEKTEVHDDIVNGGFEQGFTGWTKSGTAFSQGGVVDTDVAGQLKEQAGKAGKYFFSGYDSGNPQFTGTLQSDPFKLGGTGKIGFLMGAGMSGDKCYVEFFEQGNDTALTKVSNEAFALGYITDQMVRVVVDLSAHVGKTIYIKITDNDKGDADEYAYLNLDDFVVYKTADDVTKAEKERADKLAAIGKPAFSETETDTTIKNGGFEEGLANWLMLDGNAFGARALCSDELFWANPDVGNTATNNRSYNKEGKNFLNTYFDESATGSIRSTKFTLAGDGVISFLMAGAKNKGSYVALCDGKTDEELVKVTFDKYFSDPNLSENMVRHYIDAKDYKGKVLYLKVVDGEKSEFAGIIVDDFKVSMAEADVKAQMKADYLKAQEARTTEPVSVSLAEYNYYNNYVYPYALEVLRFTKAAEGGTAVEGQTVDLHTYLEGVTATYGEENVDVALVKISDGETEYTEELDAFTFTEVGTYTVTYKATHGEETIEATFTVVVSAATSVANGGFETGDLTGWTKSENMTGVCVISASTWWNEELPYNQSGNYHLDGWNTGVDEPNTWWVKSSTFTLEGAGIVTLKMGGHAAAVKIFKEDGTQIGYYKQTRFNDAGFPHIAEGGSWADMATYIIDLSDHIGERLYIELHDEAVSSWAHAFFDEVITYYEAGTDIDELAAKSDTVKDGHTADETPQDVQIGWVKADNLYKPVEENEYQVKNGGFETGDLTGWEFHCDTEGVTGNAVSANTTFWAEKIPYNKGGNFFYEGTNDFIPEGETWYLKSSKFTLGGSGFITFKMSGRTAEVRVFKADGTQIATYANDQFADVNFPNVGQGSRLGTMTTFVADLSAYIGEELYLELHDTGTENWGVACFDDIVTYYETAPVATEHSDTVKESNDGDEVQIAWVNAKNTYVAK